MNAAEIFETHVAERMSRWPAVPGRSGETLKVRVTGKGGGTWVIDREKGVRRGDEDAHCVITLSSEDLIAIASGRSDPRALFLAGKLKVAGYLHLAFTMAKLLAA